MVSGFIRGLMAVRCAEPRLSVYLTYYRSSNTRLQGFFAGVLFCVAGAFWGLFPEPTCCRFFLAKRNNLILLHHGCPIFSPHWASLPGCQIDLA